MDEAQITGVRDMLVGKVKHGKSLAEAQAELGRMRCIPAEGIELAAARYTQQLDAIRRLTSACATVAPTHFDWYPGPSADDVLWPLLAAHHGASLGADGPAPAGDAVDAASTRVVSLLAPSTGPRLRTRGRVLGHPHPEALVDLTAVLAKAADTGYRLLIVLVSAHDDRQRQVQAHLDRALVDLDPSRWHRFTEPGRAFEPGRSGALDVSLTTQEHRRLLCVVERQASSIQRLAGWLRRARTDLLADCAALIVDWEAEANALPTALGGPMQALVEALPRSAWLDWVRAPSVAQPSAAQPGSELSSGPYPLDFFVDPFAPGAALGA